MKPDRIHRLASVEYLRFFASCWIVGLHFTQFVWNPARGAHHLFDYASIFADFFFMLSGFMLARHVALNPPGTATESLSYPWRRALAILPPYLLALALTFLVRVASCDRWLSVTTFGEFCQTLFHFKWEAVMLHLGGFTPHPRFGADYLLGPAWFVSALLIGLIPAAYLAFHHRRIYAGVIAPLSVILIYGGIIQRFGDLDRGNELAGGVVMIGNLRAFAGISAGWLAFYIFEHLPDVFSRPGRRFSAVAESVCWLSVIGIGVLPVLFRTPADSMVMIPVFGILMVLCTNGQSPVARFLNNAGRSAGRYLGRLSVYVFLFHWMVLVLLKNWLFQNKAGFQVLEGIKVRIAATDADSIPFVIALAVTLLAVFTVSAILMRIMGFFAANRKKL